MNWNNIRSFQNSQNEGFEELVCQLARKEQPADALKFIRKGKPDAGVECFWGLNNNKEWAWQAKYFTASLTNTQWNQIDSSVKTVLEHHPNLEKYTIAIPIDPADARVNDASSMLDKWNKRVKKWEDMANAKGMTVEFIPWWSSDLVERLQKLENAGLTYFWFNKEEFTDEWCIEQNEFAITDLGNRYTPQLNVELEISKLFNALGRDKYFQQEFRKVADDFFIKGKRIIKPEKEAANIIGDISSQIDSICYMFTGINFESTEAIPFDKINNVLNEILQNTSRLREYYDVKEEEDIKSTSTEIRHADYGYEKYEVNNFESSIYSFQHFINGVAAILANNPFLLLNGEAGIGKSHLIADVVSRRNKNGERSLLLLGQYFVTDEDPWTQIFKKLNIRCSIDEFLGALNAKAESNRSRFVIFIDALNEGRGKYFWGTNIKTFVKKVQKYDWIGIVLSVRTTYKRLIFPDEIQHKEFITEYTHRGFQDIEFEATRIYFENYNIVPPTVPLLHPEFQNPLFLKLFCEGLKKGGYTRVPDGMQGLTTIIDFFVDSVNKALSKANRFDYSDSINIVGKVINALFEEKAKTGQRYIEYEKAIAITNDVISPYSTKRGFLDELVHEGVLSKNLYWESNGIYKEGVFLAYERFEDHLTVKYLLEKCQNIDSAFIDGGEFYDLVKDEYTCYINQGIIEAFSIQLPERTGKEFYEYTPHVKNTYPVAEAFVNSLLWRKTNTVSEKLLPYINKVVFAFRGTNELFWDTLLSLSANPDHYFNAYSIHENLKSRTLPERDASWTKYLSNRYEDDTSVKRIVDWAWSSQDKSYTSDDSMKLICITLAWFLTSTNRRLRDYATKGLINLLKDRIHLSVDLLDAFKDVDDPYVYERLFAAAYGAAIWTENKDYLPKLCTYIYNTIFDTEEVYPHVLLRDYARSVIEYTMSLGSTLELDIDKVRPPYKSSFTDEPLSDDEIVTRYEIEREHENYQDFHYGQNAILSSMNTEHGKRAGGYGDFGRYTFESALRYWGLDTNMLSNVAIEWIFEKYGYDSSIHGDFDRTIGTGRGRSTWPQERIGKKYQWLALFELLARVSDNFDMYSRMNYYSSDREKELYQGTWMPYVRDIDPTILIKGKSNDGHISQDPYWWEEQKYSNWNLSNKDWVHTNDDLPKVEELISVTDTSGEEWLVLESFPEWESPKQLGEDSSRKSRKLMWYQIRSYLIPSDNYKKVIDWSKDQDFMGRWMPENSDRYEVFSREYYWSPAYEYFKKAYDEGEIWRDITDNSNGKSISKAMVSTDSYMWEAQNDASKDDVIRILKPCNDIFHSMKLNYAQNEGEFIDENGRLVCFEASVYHNCKQNLLIKKVPFLDYLKKNNLEILWTMIGEKNIIGGFRDDYSGRLEISGGYYISNGKIEGNIKTRIS